MRKFDSLSEREILEFARVPGPDPFPMLRVSAGPASSEGQVRGKTGRDARDTGRNQNVEPTTRRAIPASRTEAGALSRLRPLVRGEIPVVPIPGPGSGPRSWASMIQDLRAPQPK